MAVTVFPRRNTRRSPTGRSALGSGSGSSSTETTPDPERASVPPHNDIIFGYHYSIARQRRRLVQFHSTNTKSRVGYRWLPFIPVVPKFEDIPAAGATLHRALVVLGKNTYLVCGYTAEKLPPSASVTKIKKSTIWKGELMVFSVGKRDNVLCRRPVVAKGQIDLAAALFVSRVSEAQDLNMKLPTLIKGTEI